MQITLPRFHLGKVVRKLAIRHNMIVTLAIYDLWREYCNEHFNEDCLRLESTATTTMTVDLDLEFIEMCKIMGGNTEDYIPTICYALNRFIEKLVNRGIVNKYKWMPRGYGNSPSYDPVTKKYYYEYRPQKRSRKMGIVSIRCPDGTVEQVDNIKAFCAKHDLRYESFRTAAWRRKPYKHYFMLKERKPDEAKVE